MFKLGDYVNHNEKDAVLHLTKQMHVDIVNAHEGYRHATQEEIEEYHWEEFE